MKKILIALVAVIVVAVGVNFLFPSINSITDFKHIKGVCGDAWID